MKPAALFVVPPYSTLGPPAGMAYLLGYLRDQKCNDFSFIDLRLGMPTTYAPTYVSTGVFGEGYVMDIPDLPLVLCLLKTFKNGTNLNNAFDLLPINYTQERGISRVYLNDYLHCMNAYLSEVTERIDAKFIGCSTWTSNYLMTLLFCAYLKRRKNPPIIVLGGPQTTQSESSANLALTSGLVDYVIKGEGEISLFELYSGGSNSNIVSNQLMKMNNIPIPDYDQMHLRSYENIGLPLVSYHLSRGCTDKCTFCSEWQFWERFRPGDGIQTVEGIKELQKRYGIQYIEFTDSLLNGHPGKLHDFVEGMLALDTPVKWGGFMRANMTYDYAKTLKKAGCRDVFVGIESMSNDTLNLMNKRRTEPQNIEALRAFLSAGIRVVAGVIPGFPGDTREAFTHTIQLLTDIMQEFPNTFRTHVEPFTVAPGQPLYKNLESYGLNGIRWDDETVNIMPEYENIVNKIYCKVEGSSQGLERVGRLKMVQSIRIDAPVRVDIFDCQGEEFIVRTEFDFDFIVTGWHIARIKSNKGFIYSLIVTDEEKEILEISGCDVLAQPHIRKLTSDIELKHIIPPFTIDRLISGGYKTQLENEYTISPYVIARSIDDEICVVEVIEPRFIMIPNRYSIMLMNDVINPSYEDLDIIKLLSDNGMILSIGGQVGECNVKN